MMPKKCCKSCLDFEKSMYLISLTFSWSEEIPFSDILYPKNISLVTPKIHLSLFNFKPDFWILFKTQCKYLVDFWSIPIWCYRLGYSLLPLQASVISSMSCGKTSPPLCIPWSKHLNRSLRKVVENVGSFDDSSSTFICQ